MKKVKINDQEYEVVENHKDSFDLTEVTEKMTDYFDDFDYILGDVMYEKLRLKGFCEKGNKRFNNINDISKKEQYLKQNCAYVEKYFLLKKVV